jgi:peptidoglycan hydrolase CwlO-like protein
MAEGSVPYSQHLQIATDRDRLERTVKSMRDTSHEKDLLVKDLDTQVENLLNERTRLQATIKSLEAEITRLEHLTYG